MAGPRPAALTAPERPGKDAAPQHSPAAPTGTMVQVWNPAFDVTPARLIAGIITEHGLVPKGSQGFQVSHRGMHA